MFGRMALIFCTSLGVVLGASLIGSISSLFTDQMPVRTMLRLAKEIKLWAIVAAIGGTFATFEILESGLFNGEIRVAVKQLLYIFSSLMGAQLGYWIIVTLAGSRHL